MRLSLLLPVLVLAAGAAACGDDDDGPDGLTLSEDAVIEYRFNDSSVPPEYHRSYTLTVDPTEVRAVVDSYGDVLGDETVPLPADVWAGLADGVDDIVDLDFSDDDDGCAGGTGRELKIVDGGDEELDVTFGVCGDSNEEAAETLDAYVQPVIDAIPDWDQLGES